LQRSQTKLSGVAVIRHAPNEMSAWRSKMQILLLSHSIMLRSRWLLKTLFSYLNFKFIQFRYDTTITGAVLSYPIVWS
jgi:hypothetical protein